MICSLLLPSISRITLTPGNSALVQAREIQAKIESLWPSDNAHPNGYNM